MVIRERRRSREPEMQSQMCRERERERALGLILGDGGKRGKVKCSSGIERAFLFSPAPYEIEGFSGVF